ncbi:sigma-70 family RNA polymerase sigma factor [Paenibacillus tyrfis]|uniref:sigma-70 family RNA polymerase sigma factor n=1 Tax=Paenibacillus tyrfis TaxID=1501230 RepID=UPI000B591101|nr:sigma-70 family RNA polymerase sigma factor [Paenibacillus tyrfis]
MLSVSSFEIKAKVESKSIPIPFAHSTDYIVRRFFSYPDNHFILFSYVECPSLKTWEPLEEAFNMFHFEVRFTKYLSSTIKYAFIDFHRKKRKRDEWNVFIFDMELYEETGRTFGESYSDNKEESKISSDPSVLLDSISNECVYKAFSKLTQKQKIILTLTYSMCFLDRDIAVILSISPQAVSKARSSAIVTLKKRLTREVLCNEQF